MYFVYEAMNFALSKKNQPHILQEHFKAHFQFLQFYTLINYINNACFIFINFNLLDSQIFYTE